VQVIGVCKVYTLLKTLMKRGLSRRPGAAATDEIGDGNRTPAMAGRGYSDG
jgi:hypothetical protein